MAAGRARPGVATATGGAGRAVAGGTVGPAFVGRESSLAVVTDALRRRQALVCIEGEPGIGKTRLLHEALAGVAGRTVLLAACPPVWQPFPLGPVVDGTRRLRPDLGGVELSALAGALRPLFPEWADQLPPAPEALDEPRQTRHRLMRALWELVDQLGVEILVLEDAHWADTATLEWLLMMTTSGVPGIPVVVTFRREDVPPDSLLPRLTSRPVAGRTPTSVRLRPLDVAQTRRLVGSMLGIPEVSAEFAAFLHEHTDGVPLALEETVRLLRERRAIIHRGGAWTRRVLDELEVSPVVRDSVLERVIRLDPDTRTVLQAAAIVGAPADERVLATVSDLDEHACRRGLAAALGSGLLQEASPGRFGFRHVLDSQVVSEAVAVSDRRRLHRRAGEVLEATQPRPVAQLAGHFRGAGDIERWCRYAQAAAELALESGDERTAVALLHGLLAGAELPVDRRLRLARRLGEVTVNRAEHLGGLEADVRKTLGELVAGGGGPGGEEHGEVRLLLGWLLYQLGEFDEGRAQLIDAVGELSTRPAKAARAMLYLASPASHRSWPVARHLEWLRRAAALLPRVESPSERSALAIDRAVTLLHLGEEAGWQAADELPQSASTLAGRRQVVRGRVNVATYAIDWGRYRDARARLAAAATAARTTGFSRLTDFVSVDTALLNWYMGDWDGLAALVAQLGDAEEVHPLVRLEARSIHGMLDLVRGNRVAAERRMRQVRDDAPDNLVETSTALPVVALGRLCLADGDAAGALRVTAARMRVIADKGTWMWASDIAPVHVDALAGAGRLARAGELLEHFEAWLRGRVAPAPAAALVTCEAIVAQARGGQDRAARLFGEAATAWAELPRPYDELLALERQGVCRLAAGEEAAAVESLTGVQRRMSELGARWDADRVARLLRRHGVEGVRAWRPGRRGYRDQLSPRERQVAALVARGMTNKQVAQRLFISPKTVEHHLAAAMRKMSVSSRTALAMAASSAGVLPDAVAGDPGDLAGGDLGEQGTRGTRDSEVGDLPGRPGPGK